MPQAIPGAIKFLAVTLASIGVPGKIASFVAGATIRAGLGLGAASIAGALAPRPKAPKLSNPGLQLQIALDPSVARQVVYGETALAGQLIYRTATGVQNKFLHYILALGDAGPYEGIQEVRLDSETVTLNGSNFVTSPSKWDQLVRVETKLGTLTQTAFTNAASEITQWTTAHAGKGVALAHIRYELDQENLTNPLEPLFIVRGRNTIYDPRLDSSPGNDPTNASYQAWTQNPVLWILDYLLGVEVNGRSILGLGVPNALIDWQSFADAADVCDETVSVKAGGTIPRYSGGGGVISAEDDPIAVIEAMLSACAGILTTRSGKIAVYAGEAQTAAVTLTDDDLAGPVSISSARSIRETANTGKARYRDSSNQYDFTDAPEYQNATWLSEDGSQVLSSRLDLPFTDDHRVAQRLSKIFVGDKREPRELSGLFKIKALQILEGEVFNLSSDSYGAAANGKYRLLRRKVNPDSTVEIVARSETDAKYSWTAASEEQDPPANGVQTGTPPTTEQPSGWTASASEITGPQGAVQTVIDIAPPGAGIPASVQFVEVQYKREDGPSLQLDAMGDQYQTDASGASGDSAYIPLATLTREQAADGERLVGVERSQVYSIRIRYRSFQTLSGDWETLSVSVGAAGSALAAPSGWTAAETTIRGAEGYDRPGIQATAPSAGVPVEAGFVAIDIRTKAETEFSDQLVLSRAEAARGRTITVLAGTDYYVRVRYGGDASTWGPEQIIPVSTAATGALSLSGFAVASSSTTSGSMTRPGFLASWTALSATDQARAALIAIQYRRNGDTVISSVNAEPDDTSRAVWGLLPGETYNVRARAQDALGAGEWTTWTNVTVSSSEVVGGINGQGALATLNDVAWGSQITGRPSNLASLTGSENILNSGITIGANGVLTGAGGGTVTLSGLGGGALASLDTVGAAQIDTGAVTGDKIGSGAVGPAKIASSYLLVSEEAGKPSSGSARVVRDTTNDLVWHWDGSNARLMSAESSSSTNSSGETVTETTNWEVVAVTSLAGVDENTLIGMNNSDLDFTTPDAASSAALLAQWAVIVASSQTSAGSTIASGTNTLFVGATDGITFFDDGGDITVQTSDFPSAANPLGPRFLTGFTGTVYVHLCLRITTGSGSLFTTAPTINVPRIS